MQSGYECIQSSLDVIAFDGVKAVVDMDTFDSVKAGVRSVLSGYG